MNSTIKMRPRADATEIGWQMPDLLRADCDGSLSRTELHIELLCTQLAWAGLEPIQKVREGNPQGEIRE